MAHIPTIRVSDALRGRNLSLMVLEDIIRRPIDHLGFSRAARSCLLRAHIETVVELVIRTEKELLREGFPSEVVDEIDGVLNTFGYHLNMTGEEIERWTPPARILKLSVVINNWPRDDAGAYATNLDPKLGSASLVSAIRGVCLAQGFFSGEVRVELGDCNISPCSNNVIEGHVYFFYDNAGSNTAMGLNIENGITEVVESHLVGWHVHVWKYL